MSGEAAGEPAAERGVVSVGYTNEAIGANHFKKSEDIEERAGRPLWPTWPTWPPRPSRPSKARGAERTLTHTATARARVKATGNLPLSRFCGQSSGANRCTLTSLAYARCSSNQAEISVQYQRRPRLPTKSGRGNSGCFRSFQRVVRPTLKRTQISSTEPTAENGDGDGDGNFFIKIHQ